MFLLNSVAPSALLCSRMLFTSQEVTMVVHSSDLIFDWIVFILASNKDMHNIWRSLNFGQIPTLATEFSVNEGQKSIKMLCPL